jgi:hypothetical protein
MAKTSEHFKINDEFFQEASGNVIERDSTKQPTDKSDSSINFVAKVATKHRYKHVP